MDIDEYMILSLPPMPIRKARSFQSEDRHPPVQMAIDRLTPHEVQEIVAAPGTLGVVRAKVPLKLIEPSETATPLSGASGAWGLEAVGASDCKRTGAGAKVAILDTGCEINHEAFRHLDRENRIKTRNFTAGAEQDVIDIHGHGTHCAGTICGSEVGGMRIGVAPGVEELLVGKVLGDGGGTNDVVTRAMLWASEQGATIISMSLGIDFPGLVDTLHTVRGLPLAHATSMALRDYRNTVAVFAKVTQLLASRAVLVIAASGNESSRPAYTIDKSPPSASEHVLSVAAVGRSPNGLVVAPFSNTGADIAAPGVGVTSAKVGGGTTACSGTSMATPHVVGVAALWSEWLNEHMGIVTHDTLKARLLAMATPLPGMRFNDVGSGLVRAPD